MDQPSIEIFGITVQEPVTALTDLLVSGVCFCSFVSLSKNRGQTAFYRLYAFFILSMGFATFYGGIIGHAFLYAFGFKWKVPGWIISMLSVGLAERASIFHARAFIKPVTGNLLAVANVVEVITLMFIAVYTLNFFFVELHATYGLLLVVFSFELFVYLKTKKKASVFILWAVGVSALAALVHLSKFTIHTWFNHLDLSHVLMAVSSYLFYKGVYRMKM